MIKALISGVAYGRACLYYEAYKLGSERAPEDFITPAFWVGVFDGALLAAIAYVGAWLSGWKPVMENWFPKSVVAGDVPGLLGVLALGLYVGLAEYLYFRYCDDGRTIVRRFSGLSVEGLANVNRVGMLYAITSLTVGGALLVVVRRSLVG